MSDFPHEAAGSASAARDSARSGVQETARGWGQSSRVLRAGDANYRSTPSVELHIDQVVLEGLQGINRAEFGLVLESELARLLAQGGLAELSTGPDADRVDGGVIPLGGSIETRTLARRLARAVYSGLTL